MARYFKGSAGISITTLPLPDRPSGERGVRGGKKKKGREGKKKKIRGSQRQEERVQTQRERWRELVLVSTLFISLVGVRAP